ncbi:unnamed protein product [Prunus brigantina]
MKWGSLTNVKFYFWFTHSANPLLYKASISYFWYNINSLFSSEVFRLGIYWLH